MQNKLDFCSSTFSQSICLMQMCGKNVFWTFTVLRCLCLLFRWLSYVLLLLLDLLVCFFILLGLAKQARWLLIL